ncbi:hypothetical protein DM872_18935 [Pseudomonas taiwanensis]|uniref:hypothetical protein n=1 Tax=Pseudomonas taiwanensis TaxID=470150 RepID=UPI0015BEEB2D|nr:hypothetical protein [Pseudomonas taiwanensis]NWL78926.1 hypothetical protein [Pseudomonas taiwanensis]
MKPFQNKTPDRTYTQSVKSLGLTQVTFHNSDIRAAEMAASDPVIYAQVMQEAFDEQLNGPEWRENMNNAFPSEVRPFGSVPTAPQVALMADRSVTFDPRQTYDGRTVTQGEAVAGSLVSMEAPDVGILVSARISILDHTVQFGFTERSMEQTGDKALNDLELTLAGKIAESLEGQPSVSKVYAGPLTGTPAAQAEDVLDLLAVHLDTFWGRDIAEFGVLVPVSLRPVLNRAAQRAGLEDIDDLVGTRVQVYSGPDRGIFLVPKAFALLSFRENKDGDVWHIELTRNSALLSWELEVSAVVDVMATAMVEVKVAGSDWETTSVALPIVKQIVLTEQPAPEGP